MQCEPVLEKLLCKECTRDGLNALLSKID